MQTALSIHPRNWPKTGNGEIKNTCAPRKRDNPKKLARKLNKLSVRQIERDKTLIDVRKRTPGLLDGAFKRPGSMKGRV